MKQKHWTRRGGETVSVTVCRTVRPMERIREKTRRGGRRSKGPRLSATLRLPTDKGELLFRLADRRGISLNEWLNEAVDEKLARTDLAVEDPQGQLPIDQQEAS